MEQVTYLFGAGASQKAVPIQVEMSKKIYEMRQFLSDGNFYFSKGVNSNGNKLLQELIVDLTWLENISEENNSVDAYAHLLRIAGDSQNLKKLKNVYSTFFVLHQA